VGHTVQSQQFVTQTILRAQLIDHVIELVDHPKDGGCIETLLQFG
jgi:hypothetical protein